MLMTAYNIIGESPTSAPVEVFVGEAGRCRKISLFSFFSLSYQNVLVFSREYSIFVLEKGW